MAMASNANRLVRLWFLVLTIAAGSLVCPIRVLAAPLSGEAPPEAAGNPADGALLSISPPDPAPKGLQVHRDELPGQIPKIAAVDANWVRLEFKKEPDHSIDLARYAAIVEGLREQGMGVIGLVDYATIPQDLDSDGQPDWDDPADYLAYQQRLVDTVEVLAGYFRGSIRHWEIWNEENGARWHIRPAYYARLLVQVSEVIKGADAANQVLFGGLDHVWATSQYLEPVYDALDAEWGGARPFDILAVHPYFISVAGQPVLDPNVYLWDGGDPPRTILDPYLDFMASRGDGDVDVWITEIGWNSALDNPAIEACPSLKPWCVDRATQAGYLQDSLDILLFRVEDPEGNRDRVKTVVWYQYHDTATTLAKLAEKLPIGLEALGADPWAICPADWGLVDGNRMPKPSYDAFRDYLHQPVGVTLASLTVSPQQGAVLVAWETVTETNTLGFNLYRARPRYGPRVRLNGELIEGQAPGSSAGAAYTWYDEGLGPGIYYYWLEAVDLHGATRRHGPVSVTVPAYRAYLPLLPAGRPHTSTSATSTTGLRLVSR